MEGVYGIDGLGFRNLTISTNGRKNCIRASAFVVRNRYDNTMTANYKHSLYTAVAIYSKQYRFTVDGFLRTKSECDKQKHLMITIKYI